MGCRNSKIDINEYYEVEYESPDRLESLRKLEIERYDSELLNFNSNSNTETIILFMHLISMKWGR